MRNSLGAQRSKPRWRKKQEIASSPELLAMMQS